MSSSSCRHRLCVSASISSDQTYDVVVVGGGHNALVSAAYLAKAGLSVCVLEKRAILGGTTVTEELKPGFRFSRASYLAGLLRPSIVRDLELPRHGFSYLIRDPSSFTPTLVDGPHAGKCLVLGADDAANAASVAQFSVRDALALPRYDAFLTGVRRVLEPLLDGPPPDPTQGKWRERLSAVERLIRAASAVGGVGVGPLTELFTAPAASILDRWFESDVLKATLATDSVIGALVSPQTPGSGYVLLHHVMGESAGRPGVWSYIRGGMGALSNAVAGAAREAGAELRTSADVTQILQNDAGRAEGVRLADGTVVRGRNVIATCTPWRLFNDLLPASSSPPSFLSHICGTDYSSGAFKVNLALSSLPRYTCLANPSARLGLRPGAEHTGTAHFEASIGEIHEAYLDAAVGGQPSRTPVVELTIPSVLDDTLTDTPGTHVASLFCQYAPYDLSGGRSWEDPSVKAAFAKAAIGVVDRHAPGFAESVIYADVLSPLDLERTFGLHRGSIFHGALSLHQLAYNRPAPGFSSHRTPVEGLYLGGSGAHPGGGVSGAPGRNSAAVLLSDLDMAPWW